MTERRIHPYLWGQDHWSTLTYIETRIVDCGGKPDARHLQTNSDRHGMMGNTHDGSASSTRLRFGLELPGDQYDDWDCIDDFIAFGLLENTGTGTNPVYRLTEAGWDVVGRLRRHRAEGGDSSFGPFVLTNS